MAGNKHLWKHFSTPSLQSQVLDIKEKNEQKELQNSESSETPEELIIPSAETPKKKRKPKKEVKK